MNRFNKSNFFLFIFPVLIISCSDSFNEYNNETLKGTWKSYLTESVIYGGEFERTFKFEEGGKGLYTDIYRWEGYKYKIEYPIVWNLNKSKLKISFKKGEADWDDELIEEDAKKAMNKYNYLDLVKKISFENENAFTIGLDSKKFRFTRE